MGIRFWVIRTIATGGYTQTRIFGITFFLSIYCDRVIPKTGIWV